MSLQEERREIVDLIPKLITSLTDLKEGDENFKRYEEFVWDSIKSYKSVSVNSHEVQRKLDAVQEKFIYGNFHREAEQFKKLCDFYLKNALSVDHYQFDIQWRVLDFLLRVSYNPTGALRKSQQQISTMIEKNESEVDEHKSLLNELQEDFIVVKRSYDSDDSDISDWSNSSFESQEDETLLTTEKSERKFSKSTSNVLDVLRPRKLCSYTAFNLNVIEGTDILRKFIQPSWWLQTSNTSRIYDSHGDADFCNIWNTHLKQTNSKLSHKSISIISEFQFLREIIWMFYIPTTCTLFEIHNGDVKVRNNISLSSTTITGFRYMVNYFLPYIKMLNNLKKFISTIFNVHDQSPPKTYEFYTTGLEDLLKPFYDNIFKIEETIQSQMKINTALHLLQDMNHLLSYLQDIHFIHKTSILDYTTTPAHICSAFLLTNLLTIVQTSSCVQVINIATSLFLSSVKVFCNIIDVWWTDGRLDDWKNEFLVERCEKSNEINSRLYAKSKEKSFFVTSEVSKIIQNNTFFKLVMNHSLEAGCTLNLLFEIQKIRNLKNTGSYEENLYNSFINDVISTIKLFQSNQITNEDEQNVNENSSLSQHLLVEDDQEDVNLNIVDDDLLRMVFEINITDTVLPYEKNVGKQRTTYNILKFYEMLCSTPNLILPLEEIICKSFSKVLETRISCANEFVVNIYHNEFEILKHTQNIRRVLLLESNDLMYSFYTKLFTQIETGKNWMNPLILTLQLNDIIQSKFPETSSLYRVEINTKYKNQTNTVLEAIDELVITYNLKKELKNIITESNVQQYNKVFQFLLKVKWAVWTLENFRFPKHKHFNKGVNLYGDLKMINFLLRRLEQVRFWVMYSVQCIHFHLMSYVLQTMGMQLDRKIQNCTNLSEMKFVHESYINTICKHCFITESSRDIKKGIEQLLSLVYVIKLEWQNCSEIIESEENLNENLEENNDKFKLLSEIDAIERSYTRLHQYLAKLLNNAVYVNQQTYLYGLSAAFNTSVPY